MQLRCLRFAFKILLISGGILTVLYFKGYDILPSSSHNLSGTWSSRAKYVKRFVQSSSACRLPNLDPYHPTIMKFMKDLGKLECKGEIFSNFKGDILEVKGKGIYSGRYRMIQRPRGDDSKAELSDPIEMVNLVKPTAQPNQRGFIPWSWFFRSKSASSNPGSFLGKAKVKSDLIRVDVVTTSGEVKSDVHMQVIPKDEVLSRSVQNGGIPLDISLIMFDSTSAANFQRKMPNTLEYLTKHLNSVVLEGETIVGDGTTAQLCALLTGIAEKDQPEARRSESNSITVDNWRWIFKNFKQHGYATLFSEDFPRLASFNYRLLGFKDPPTDHYSRPFWLEAENVIKGHCIGGRASHNISLEYLMSFYRAYKDRPKFSLVTHAVISHDDQNTIGYSDDDLKTILQTMENESFLNNTLLIIFGDHGARFSNVRKSIQGKLEERLPFMSITVPKWFMEKYRVLYKNLIHNSKVMTTPFDVYATLRHILSYPSYPSGITTGQSLFNRIDKENRTCENSGVEEHWCPCLNLEEVSIDKPLVKMLAEFVVTFMNKLMSKYSELKHLCHKLVLREIKSAYGDMPSAKLQFFEKSRRDDDCDSCGVIFGEKSVNTLADNTLYQLQLTTSPNDGFYEATIKVKEGVPSLRGDISRIDAYGNQPDCIADKFPLLRKYCYCS
ncbi:uncharacterized protein LOC111331587 [Stylophora pistillata]|uniref:Uncharacterized protein n=1 Tax=Stylophora pistillata TaxID=50429 RepID=A0A2B4S630_STYPI|nr:uncharacterized protein LOC111331587 [Stylophora pistillata]PFX24499.1 hypothetical protein AWC38_SpisGene10904 [Stylophora pistillata]